MGDTLKLAVVAIILLSAMRAVPLAAYEVYRWVDANGVVNYSQVAPAEAVEGISQQTLADAVPAVRDPQEDLYSVEATAEEMRALWDEIEQRREANHRRQPQAAKQVELQRQEPYYATPVWYGGSINRPGQGPPRPPPQPEGSPPTSTIKWPE